MGRLKENPEHYGAEGGSVNLQKDKTKKENKKSCCWEGWVTEFHTNLQNREEVF